MSSGKLSGHKPEHWHMIACAANSLVALSVWPDLSLIQPLHLAGWSENWHGPLIILNRQFGHGKYVLGSLRVYLYGGELYCTIWFWCLRRIPVSFTRILKNGVWNTCPTGRKLGTLGKGTVLRWWKTCKVLYLFGMTVFNSSYFGWETSWSTSGTLKFHPLKPQFGSCLLLRR